MVIKEVTPPRERLFVLEVSDKELKRIRDALVNCSYISAFDWNEEDQKIVNLIQSFHINVHPNRMA
jgi:hypothetical protein